jgi:hypothetical protein
MTSVIGPTTPVATLGDVVSAPGNCNSRKPWHARKHIRK